MARFYVIALRNDIVLGYLALRVGQQFPPSVIKPQLSEALEDKLTLVADEILQHDFKDGKELLENKFSLIDEAVEVESSGANIRSFLRMEKLSAIEALSAHLLGETLEPRLAEFNWTRFIADLSIVKDVSRIENFHILPGFIEPPPGWTETTLLKDERSQAAIVYITEDEFKTLPNNIQMKVARALRAAQNNPNNTILKRLAETCETLSRIAPSKPAPGEDTRRTGAAEEAPAPDDAETDEAGTADIDFPPGFEVVKNPYKPNDQGEPKPMRDETLKRFVQIVLPYIKEIGAHNAPPERWELAKKRGTPHPERGENAIIRYDGIDYVIYINEKLNRFGVKLDKLPPRESGKPAFFYFIGKVEPS